MCDQVEMADIKSDREVEGVGRKEMGPISVGRELLASSLDSLHLFDGGGGKMMALCSRWDETCLPIHIG